MRAHDHIPHSQPHSLDIIRSQRLVIIVHTTSHAHALRGESAGTRSQLSSLVEPPSTNSHAPSILHLQGSGACPSLRLPPARGTYCTVPTYVW
ncbi:hypothetical protein Forpe1208_v010502 [Fusarium oxysporum f. sp. rapae]|uniref:Uncharacterized protein n=1 Tax=Fusarium oxysporum f. sp. rapae TaxID=485398 RepID=A0A8J5TTI2_FUSOX|nr:hypothetical protein Forpe1208_v010502 [Fusarium oxysporum f. sp. rapae]